MKLGAAGTALIQSFEKLRYQAYQDPRGIWTCGWGHTGPDVAEFTTCDDAQASAWFIHDTQTACNAIMGALDVAVTQNQFDALVSFCFNVGAHAAAGSTLLNLLNGGHIAQAADQFGFWNHVNGQVDEGLTRRRAAEKALFLTP